MLERDIAENRHPARIDSLPYPKRVIKDAIRTSVETLVRSGALTAELREFLEVAYTSLADYIDRDLVDLMTEYRRSAADLAAVTTSPQEKTGTPAWRTVAGSSALAGEVARSIATEADALKTEFDSFL
jgi:hypothetical protein